MARLTYKQLNKLKEKYGVDRIWSFSRISTFEQCKWAYKALYVDHAKVDTSNVYTYWGTISHDLIQDFYDKKIKYDEMIEKWNDAVFDWQLKGQYQFDTDKIKVGYLANLNHYFQHTQVVKPQVTNEVPTIIELQGDKRPYVFVGYIDGLYQENGNYYLMDYKTSSKSSFSGRHLPEKSMQLMLYAIGIHQKYGVPYENIKCRFDMMKYVTVTFKQENGKWKDTVQERKEWVKKIRKKLETKLKKAGLEDEMEELLRVAESNNDLSNLPKSIQDQFLLSNYYITVDITDQTIAELKTQVVNLCDKIYDFEQLEDKVSWLEVNYPYNPNDYYETHLCAFHSTELFKQYEGLDDLTQDKIQEVPSKTETIFTPESKISEDDLNKMLFG